MVEVSGQLFGVVLVVAGAIGYLGLVLRRSWAGRGGCSGCQTKSTADTAVAHGSAGAASEPQASEKLGETTAFFPLENLTDIARQRRDEQTRNRG